MKEFGRFSDDGGFSVPRTSPGACAELSGVRVEDDWVHESEANVFEI